MLLSINQSSFRKSFSNFLYISIFWLVQILLSIYFSANIVNIGVEGGVLLPVLIMACLGFTILFFFQFHKISNFSFRFLSLFFLLWVTYITLKIALETPNGLGNVRTFWFSTTGGGLIFYLIGCCTQTSLEQINCITIKSNTYLKHNDIIGKLYLVTTTIIYIICLFSFLSKIRSDIFLINDSSGMYQRPGMFITMNFILYSINFHNIKKQSNNFNIIFTLIYCFMALICAVSSQLFGSNNAFVMISGIAFISISLCFFFRKIQKKVTKHKLNYVFNKELSLLKYIKFLCKYSLIFIAIIIILLSIFKESLPPLRIFGFNKESGSSSIESRIRLIQNHFIDDFEKNPIWGSMNLKHYVHSFVFSILTHTGIFGFLLFVLFLTQGIIDSNKTNNLFKLNSLYSRKLSILIGILALMIASMATFISWAPIWLTFGLNFPFFKTKLLKD